MLGIVNNDYALMSCSLTIVNVFEFAWGGVFYQPAPQRGRTGGVMVRKAIFRVILAVAGTRIYQQFIFRVADLSAREAELIKVYFPQD